MSSRTLIPLARSRCPRQETDHETSRRPAHDHARVAVRHDFTAPATHYGASMHAVEVDTLSARVTLPGHPMRAARLRVVRYPRRKRFLRAVKQMSLIWTLIPFLWIASLGLDIILLPIPFVVGIIWGYHVWKQGYRVLAVEAQCPRCGTPLPLKPGDTIELPHTFDCFTCHFRPALGLSRNGVSTLLPRPQGVVVGLSPRLWPGGVEGTQTSWHLARPLLRHACHLQVGFVVAVVAGELVR